METESGPSTGPATVTSSPPPALAGWKAGDGAPKAKSGGWLLWVTRWMARELLVGFSPFCSLGPRAQAQEEAGGCGFILRRRRP